MKNEIKIFRPRYSLRTRLIIIGLPALFFALMCNASVSFIKFPSIFWMLSLIAGLCTSLVPFIIIREIRFQNEMIIRRHFLPDYFFTYKDLDQIDDNAIHAGGQRIRMGQMTNLNELKNMSQRWKADKLLRESQHAEPKNKSLYMQKGYGTYASFWGLMFGIIVMFIHPAWLPINPQWMLGSTFLLVYYAYIYVVPKYL